MAEAARHHADCAVEVIRVHLAQHGCEARLSVAFQFRHPAQQVTVPASHPAPTVRHVTRRRPTTTPLPNSKIVAAARTVADGSPERRTSSAESHSADVREAARRCDQGQRRASVGTFDKPTTRSVDNRCRSAPVHLDHARRSDRRADHPHADDWRQDPETGAATVVPLTVAQVIAIADKIEARYRALAIFAAGTGLRQGECFGLTLDRVDFLRRTVRVDRQLVKLPGSAPVFAPPKTKSSYRTILLPQVVIDALAAYPVGEDGLVFTNDDGKPIYRTRFSNIWRAAMKAAGVDASSMGCATTTPPC